MILNQEEIEKAKLAGKIAGKAIIYGKSLVKPGERMVDVLDKIELYIEQNGGKMAFPAQIAINNQAAHVCPLSDDQIVFKNEDIIKLDLGVHIDGIIADNAATVIFKEDNPRYDELLNIKKASEEALKNAIKTVAPGVTIGEVGLMIQETISRYNLSPIRNLSGHGLGKYSVHESPNIPNFNTHEKTELLENQIIAIEPFATNGHGMINETSNPTIFTLHGTKPVRSVYAREILSDIKTFNGLPFTTRWLTKKHSLAKVKLALNELKNVGSVHGYAPLLEISDGLVSQTEHTVIVKDHSIITTRRDDE